MDKMNKILYVVLDILPFAWLMKLLSGRIVPGIVHLILYFIFFGGLIGIIEGIYVAIKVPSDSDGNIEIPKGFFDFL